MKHLCLFTFVCLLGIANCHAQKNYYYFSVKAPMGGYTDFTYYEDEDGSYKVPKFNGIGFDVGYGREVSEYFALEAGVETFLLNPLNLKYYETDAEDSPYDELRVKNSYVALQLRPVFKYHLKDNVTLKGSYGINYRQMYASGKYEINSNPNDGQRPFSKSYAHAHTAASFSFQPQVGVDLRVSDNWLIGLDLSYVRANWNAVLDKLSFFNQPGLNIPDHKLNTLFLAVRVIFR